MWKALFLAALVVSPAAGAPGDGPVVQWTADTGVWTGLNSVLDSQDNLIQGNGPISKIAPDGSILWQRTLDLPGGNTLPRWLAVDSQDAVVLGGKQEGPAGGFLAAKYDSDGNLLWSAVTTIGTGPQGIRVAVDENDDVYVFGEVWGGLSGTDPTGKDFLTVKYDSGGTFQWARTAHGTGSDEPYSLAVRGGRVAVTGSAGSAYMTACYDYAGNELWLEYYTDGIWGANDVVIGSQGQVVVCGWGTTDGTFPYVGTVVQYDAAGNEDWRLYHNGPFGPVDNFRRLAIADDGSVAAVGWSSDGGAYEDWSVIKVDGGGNLSWAQHHPGTSVAWETATCVALGPAGEVYAGGLAGPGCTGPGAHATLLKFAADGTQEWLHLLPCAAPQPHSVLLDSTGGILVGVSRYAYRLVEDLPTVYCTAKVNSLGCSPAIGSTGLPSLSASVPFPVTAQGVANQKNGLFFYGLAGRTALPFLGGTLCVAPPLKRTPIQSSGGSPPPTADCSGTYSFDFNAWAQSGQDPLLTAGVPVDGQFWSRDPVHPDGTGAGLSNAIEFSVCP